MLDMKIGYAILSTVESFWRVFRPISSSVCHECDTSQSARVQLLIIVLTRCVLDGETRKTFRITAGIHAVEENT